MAKSGRKPAAKKTAKTRKLPARKIPKPKIAKHVKKTSLLAKQKITRSSEQPVSETALKIESSALPETPRPTPQNGQISLDFDLLPLWTDHEGLKMLVSDENFSFALATSSDRFLNQSKKKINPKNPAYFSISATAKGQPVGAMDGYFTNGNLLIMRAGCSEKFKRHDLFILLYCAALSLFKPANVLYHAPKSPLSAESAGLLILLGRGFGMQLIPANDKNNLLFIRRMGKESDNLSSGSELANLLSSISPLLDNPIKGAIDELMKKSGLFLVALPSSPDNREHLHELRDAAAALNISIDESVFEKLKADYVLARKDISPLFF